MSVARCNRCGKPVQWAITQKNGRPIPLDPGQTDKGNLIGAGQNGHGKLIVRKIDPGDPAARMPHAATCPNPPPRKGRAR